MLIITLVIRVTVSEESEKGKMFVVANNKNPIEANTIPAQQ